MSTPLHVGIGASFTIVRMKPATTRLPDHVHAAMAIFEKDRWLRLQPLLDQALDLSGEARASWLVGLRASAPDDADDLVWLLSAEAEADGSGFLVDAPAQSATPSSTNVHGAMHRWTVQLRALFDSRDR